MAHDSSALVEALARFARLLPTPYKVETALDELGMSVTKVFDLVGAGICLLEDGVLRFVSATAAPVATLERVQELSRQGPCMEASHTGEVVAVSDLRESTDRWPRYTETALQVGVLAVAGIPMWLNEERLGAVNLYSAGPRIWSEADLDAARILASVATGYIVNANKWNQQQQVTEQLEQALESRVVIEQAKGIIATVRNITPDAAFDLIRKHARTNRTPLHTIARAIIEAGLRV
ncbi:GAF and ANTAR domain-containing protein [Nocardia sp. BMG111209]|uniref:GAF and ANTAR domain-containing protein n=1 Tax=Nocardia sp. BMG111209 TaxID=1160137 RepID=UPI00036CC266|nr:GAF and ANTAR domain-containing protein [Nocardia sp. BMG111209]